mmetsp:Transcript_38721/g.69809  ORF Transcript_38721/g.69809 Transcript_38721/m.69809 type:complete len:633 (-) Transcript_38721:120-2018(-)|eukprot:CAMPEP_0201941330 /NCGR_PEP_ID=MMETSP0903-20130614/46944_1 /ASSEMBLY_ACC=CAM_ASM_000552 /TAXON_ID=420261 /ORGANISM="Thalassiosira antarctica, Strain CCMP982" /LENGTH=632 /DNA_ID=CAMNT_0048483375 /DNA_START=82 /DNA_END=1980 /DNA_ORIENTATION=+
MNEDGQHSLTSASRRIREGVKSSYPGDRNSPEDHEYSNPREPSQSQQEPPDAIDQGLSNPKGASPNPEQRISNIAPLSDPEYVDLHELAKGWKAALSWCNDMRTRHESRRKNDRGNLPLHSAASFRAPVEIIEGLLEAYPEAASMTNNYGNLALHFTAWKKGPLDCMKLLLQVFPEGAAQKNNHGNLPLHYAAHYNAPIEVVEALYHAFPEAARQKNNDSNTPLDLAVADGASNNVVALLQGKSVPPNDEEIYEGAKSRCERVEKEMQRQMASHDTVQEDLEVLLGFLMDVKENHPSAMYSSGIDPGRCAALESLMDQVRIAGEEEQKSIEEDEVKQIEDSLVPPDDPVEVQLSEIIGLDAIKNQLRGLRRTIEVDRLRGIKAGESDRPRHFVLTGNPGCGKTYAARLLLPLLYKIGCVPSESYIVAGRNELVDARSEERTIEKTQKVLARAKGGVLFVDEIYNLLPSNGRTVGQDHGPAALKVLAAALPTGSPLIILAGYALDLQRIVSSDIGFKGQFLLRMELPDPTPFELARMVATKLGQKGFVLGEGLTARYIADAISSMGDDWRTERNGRVADDLVHTIRMEVRKKAVAGNDGGTLSPSMSSRMPIVMPEEITITVEDFQNAFRNGI